MFKSYALDYFRFIFKNTKTHGVNRTVYFLKRNEIWNQNKYYLSISNSPFFIGLLVGYRSVTIQTHRLRVSNLPGHRSCFYANDDIYLAPPTVNIGGPDAIYRGNFDSKSVHLEELLWWIYSTHRNNILFKPLGDLCLTFFGCFYVFNCIVSSSGYFLNVTGYIVCLGSAIAALSRTKEISLRLSKTQRKIDFLFSGI